MKRTIYAMLGLLLIAGFAAAADCTISAACPAGKQIMAVYGNANSHAELMGLGSTGTPVYAGRVCCDDLRLYNPVAGPITHRANLVMLNRAANAHAEVFGASPQNYSFPEIIAPIDATIFPNPSDFWCGAFDGGCPATGKFAGVLSLNRPTNAHVAEYSNLSYSKKICCTILPVPPVASCSISPESAFVAVGGKTAAFDGTCKDASGASVPNCSLEWALDTATYGRIGTDASGTTDYGASTTFTSSSAEGTANLSASYGTIECLPAQVPITVAPSVPATVSGRFEIQSLILIPEFMQSDNPQNLVANAIVKNGKGGKNARVEFTLEGPGLAAAIRRCDPSCTSTKSVPQNLPTTFSANPLVAQANFAASGFQESKTYSVTAKLVEKDTVTGAEYIRSVQTRYFVYGKAKANVPEASPLLAVLVLGAVLGIAFWKRK